MRLFWNKPISGLVPLLENRWKEPLTKWKERKPRLPWLGVAFAHQVSGDIGLKPEAIPIPEEFVKSGKHHVPDSSTYYKMYERSITDPEGFWSEIAKKDFYWHKPFSSPILNYNFDIRKGPIFVEWFKGGKTNMCYNALDRHVEAGFGDQVAYYAEGNNLEDSGHRVVTYAELLDKVKRLAVALKARGVKKGDTVAIYLPNIPELPISMLACARIGAIHSVVFAGFSAEALAERILDARSRILITCDGVMRGDKVIELKGLADAAEELVWERGDGHLVDRQIVVQRLGPEKCAVGMKSRRDEWFHDVMNKSSGSVECPVEWMDAEDPLFVLYTSGSTGKPKGVVHTVGGYMVYSATTFKYIFDYHSPEVFFCTADCGWITGHSYTAYAALCNRATQVIFEGVPTFPSADRLWKIVDKYKVQYVYTAPTLIRAAMRAGDEVVKKTSRKSLKLIGGAGEPLNPEAWNWFYYTVGDSRCPLIDSWWQTETSGAMLTALPVPGLVQKPGSVSYPFFGVVPAILNDEGKELMDNKGEVSGQLCIKKPWPGIFRTILHNHERYEKAYFAKFPGYYVSGDGCRRDADGLYFVTGRLDDVINVSGHRIGTAEVESALIGNRAAAEAAVVPIAHEIKGQGIIAFVILKEGIKATYELEEEMKKRVRVNIGPIAVPERVYFTPSLPKTRSGKIMRRILKLIVEKKGIVSKQDLGDISTLADPQAVDELIEVYKKQQI
ncbi:Acetyl-coenzyme A synthetase, chloroplastic/glyoxysomal [Galdieria sulphuraria]|uniref:Acetyl-coenzyme A synthetase n=1 Tax=Galdieria sulphuraria TaxID=130081 RepID=M2XKP7_GALSU|nr:acetyl-CoA synthetase [Galdieria sulphuraria]EME30712.1 acetyl-CoA synthetase [Galdieria sulphuraria]GJD10787.1 Acetyl-coenzyme A synthetase, chloroplastic/glyoxysomal [Galdieria sulphuraria]|eukprot:XP_005707232.1 acetyl-CoA synthetase [Galdieria sulphuraria]